MTKVSVIVPVYNVEAYLEKCLESLIKQTLDDVEFICINDGSSDNSFKILQDYAQKDARIKIINQENKGVSYARNVGIQAARGKYISFVDSDDWIDDDFIEKLYLVAEKYNADIAACGILKHFPNKNSKKFITYKKITIAKSLSQTFKLLYIPQKNYVPNKLYLKTLITDNQIYFPVGRYYEDVFWTPQIVNKARLIVAIPNTFYHYRHNLNSITNTTKGDSQKETDYKESFEFIDEFIRKNNIKTEFRYKEKYVFRLFGIPFFKIVQNDVYKYFYLFGIKIISIKYTKSF